MNSRSITVKSLPTAGTIAGRLKMERGLVTRLLRDYEKVGYVTMRELIAKEVAEPDVTRKRRTKKRSNYPVMVCVYGLTEKGGREVEIP
jgi:DNA-binding MarR family transcriptional regulator